MCRYNEQQGVLRQVKWLRQLYLAAAWVSGTTRACAGAFQSLLPSFDSLQPPSRYSRTFTAVAALLQVKWLRQHLLAVAWVSGTLRACAGAFQGLLPPSDSLRPPSRTLPAVAALVQNEQQGVLHQVKRLRQHFLAVAWVSGTPKACAGAFSGPSITI